MSSIRTRPIGRWLAVLAAAALAAVTWPAAGAGAQESADDALLPTGSLMQCTDKQGILVATDARAQSDVYAAVVLAGIIDGCLVPAGHRDASGLTVQGAINARQASSIAYIIGSVAAVPDAKAVDAGADNATRLGGPDRFATAQLVGVEALKIAEANAEEATPAEPEMVSASADLGALTSSRSHTAPAGQTDVSATLAQARWRITAQSQVPAGKRLDASFSPAHTLGSCFVEVDGPGDSTDRHRFVWNIKADPNGGCDDAENRSVTVSTAAGDLDDYSAGGDSEPDWGWTVSFERRPAVNVPAPASVTATTRETLTPTVTVPMTGNKATRQVIRLGQGGWLLHIIDQAAGGLSGSAAMDLNDAKYGVSIDDVAVIYLPDMYDDAARYDADRFRCVTAATDENVVAAGLLARWGDEIEVVAPTDGGKYTAEDGGTAATLESVDGTSDAADDARAVWVPRGCAGYVAVQVATPGGTASDDGADDVKRWRVQAIPLAPAAN